MIDLWLIFNLLIPFVEIILISFANMFYKEAEEDIDHVGLIRYILQPIYWCELLNKVSPNLVPIHYSGFHLQTKK